MSYKTMADRLNELYSETIKIQITDGLQISSAATILQTNDMEVLFNDSGSLVGSTGMTFDKSTQTFGAVNIICDSLDADNIYTKTEADARYVSSVVASDKQVLFNSGETIIGSSAFTFDYTTATLATTNLTAGNIYNKTQVDSGFLSASTSYFTQAQATANFLSANTSYYTQAQVNSGFLSASTSFYTQAQANANFLSASTAVIAIANPVIGDIAVYTGSGWAKLALGTDGQVLTVDAANSAVTWATA